MRCAARSELIFNSRNLLRHGLGTFGDQPPAQQEALQCQLVKWTVAFCTLLKLHLREDTSRDTLAAELGCWLSPADVSLLARARHKPNTALQILSRLVKQAPQHERPAMEEALAAFSEALGRCERISRVPIPLAYTRHTSRFIIAWLLLLPFGCWTAMQWEAVLFSPLTCFLLRGIDQIGGAQRGARVGRAAPRRGR